MGCFAKPEKFPVFKQIIEVGVVRNRLRHVCVIESNSIRIYPVGYSGILCRCKQRQKKQKCQYFHVGKDLIRKRLPTLNIVYSFIIRLSWYNTAAVNTITDRIRIYLPYFLSLGE